MLTTEVQVTEVDRHVSRDLHIAPGALGVLVGITALVALQDDLGDEVLVFAEGHDTWR